jgi:hypothetical protein
VPFVWCVAAAVALLFGTTDTPPPSVGPGAARPAGIAIDAIAMMDVIELLIIIARCNQNTKSNTSKNRQPRRADLRRIKDFHEKTTVLNEPK